MRKLTTVFSRHLNSREITKIISGLLGSLAAWNDPDDLLAAIDHLAEHRDRYKKMFEVIRSHQDEILDGLVDELNS